MFTSPRYATRGVTTTVPLMLQIILWDLIDSMEVAEKDYLQVFKIECRKGCTVVTHSQEIPAYEKVFYFTFDLGFTGKIYVIDDGDHSTMLLAEEY